MLQHCVVKEFYIGSAVTVRRHTPLLTQSLFKGKSLVMLQHLKPFYKKHNIAALKILFLPNGQTDLGQTSQEFTT